MRLAVLAIGLALAASAHAEPAGPEATPPAATAASEAQAAAPAEPPKAKPDKPEMVCRRETPMGSIMAKRVCRTREQMDKEEADAKALDERLHQSNSFLRGN